MKKLLLCLIAALLFYAPALAQKDRQLIQESSKPQKRLALVIGNGNYVSARNLSNPVNDATDMANALKELGFEVILGTNLSLKQMNDKVREFGDKLKASGGVGLFYYAGHGIQVGGRNFLIPVEADIPREDEVNFNALNLDLVLQKMATANNGLNIVILDACRNNPFARSWSRGTGEEGLAQINAPTGTFIAYATSPDRTASDGSGRNGLYTGELLRVIKQPQLKIEDTFKQVIKAVNSVSKGKQVPWISSSFSGDFYFATDTDTNQTTTDKMTDTGGDVESRYWARIEKSNNAEDFNEYLREFPKGRFAPIARQRLRELNQSQKIDSNKTQTINPLTSVCNRPLINSTVIFRATKEQIIAVQKILFEKGFYAGEATGKLDDDTRSGIKKIQDKLRLKETGTLNCITLEQLGIPLTEKQKSNFVNQ
jgi:uncharacterized caspase-like protein